MVHGKLTPCIMSNPDPPFSPSSVFYEEQLFVLAIFTVLAVLAERRAAGKKLTAERQSQSHHQRSLSRAEDAAEDGHGSTGSGAAATGWRGDNGGGGAAALARQYLIVYGIVMCAWFISPSPVRQEN